MPGEDRGELGLDRRRGAEQPVALGVAQRALVLGEGLRDPLAQAAGLREGGCKLVELLEVGRSRDVAQRREQVGARAIGGDRAADLAREQVLALRGVVERVGHVGDRVLQAVLRGERAHEGEEVGQLPRELGLRALPSDAEVLGREQVARRRRSGARSAAPTGSSGVRAAPTAEDPGREDELRGIDLGGCDGRGIEACPDDVALADLRGERGHTGGQTHRDRGHDPLPQGRSAETRRSYCSRGTRRADRIEASRHEQRRAKHRHAAG